MRRSLGPLALWNPPVAGAGYLHVGDFEADGNLAFGCGNHGLLKLCVELEMRYGKKHDQLRVLATDVTEQKREDTETICVLVSARSAVSAVNRHESERPAGCVPSL